MSIDVICQECGGIVGAVSARGGREPCTCHIEPLPPDSPADTAVLDSPVRADHPPKICVVCGKDVAGHRRLKDSRGYLCLACAKAEQEAVKAGTFPCAECGRRVKPQGLVQHGRQKICKRCFADHKSAEKIRVKKISGHHFQAQEKRNLILLALVAVILLLFILWGTLG
jgi:hypothetical protein